MKKLIIIFLAFFILIPLNVWGESTKQSTTVQLKKTPTLKGEHKIDDDDYGKRIPGIPILCLISSDGVVIDAIHSEILSYEIWSEEGELCIASTDEELVFTQTLFSISGNFQIRFITEDYTLVGYITI